MPVVHARSDVPLSGACGPAEWPSDRVGSFTVVVPACPGPGQPASLPPHRSGQIDPPKATKGRRMTSSLARTLTLAEGRQGPGFSACRPTGAARVSLSGFKGRNARPLFLTPRPKPTAAPRQAVDFSAQRSAPSPRREPAILGVSADPVARQDAFKRSIHAQDPARDRTRPSRCLEGLWRLGREIDVWARHSWAWRARPC